mmetsp:Transcript_56020/g.132937  ORF Transcript_56020/g.132937 Transcript_56020/m.132937 type:complete len:203 (-) Transcript_56020:550-1158(-)
MGSLGVSLCTVTRMIVEKGERSLHWSCRNAWARMRASAFSLTGADAPTDTTSWLFTRTSITSSSRSMSSESGPSCTISNSRVSSCIDHSCETFASAATSLASCVTFEGIASPSFAPRTLKKSAKSSESTTVDLPWRSEAISLAIDMALFFSKPPASSPRKTTMFAPVSRTKQSPTLSDESARVTCEEKSVLPSLRTQSRRGL